MSPLNERRYSITEVSEMTGVNANTLRKWERRFTKLKPGRTRTTHRYYKDADINLIRRIKYLDEQGYGTDAINRQLTQDALGVRPLFTDQQVVSLVDDIDDHLRRIQSILDDDTS